MDDKPRMPSKGFRHAFAILRVDFLSDTAPPKDWNLKVTVKKVVWSTEEAQAEVSRLNRLNRDKDCLYFSQMTRVKDLPTLPSRADLRKKYEHLDLNATQALLDERDEE